MLDANRRMLVTGGAGFIGSAVIKLLLEGTDWTVLNVDCLTYASNPDFLGSLAYPSRYALSLTDIRDRAALDRAFAEFQPDYVMHLAAESHVDRSIDGPQIFIETNVLGTYHLLESARAHSKDELRFHHVSTDEVFGDLAPDDARFSHTSPYRPSSPYAASKAGSDHIARAWGRTFGLQVMVTNCSNNYGPRQFPEKLIPLVIGNALAGKPLPIYGNGSQIRDWLYVEDHARALLTVAEQGTAGETYMIGGNNEVRNIDIVRTLCRLLDDRVSAHPNGVARFEDLITYVTDRPGHDRRYAVDISATTARLDWEPAETFVTGLEKTVDWYLANRDWADTIRQNVYGGERLGQAATS